MALAQKPDLVFRRNGRVHLNRRGRQFSRLLAAEVCASAVVMLDTPCSKVVRRVLATHSIRQFLLHFPSRASPCAITFQLDSMPYLVAFKTSRYRRGKAVCSPVTYNSCSHCPLTRNALSNYFKVPHCPIQSPACRRIGSPVTVNRTIITKHMCFGM
jgi:hypothetical protein